jgi:hypothetical protein
MVQIRRGFHERVTLVQGSGGDWAFSSRSTSAKDDAGMKLDRRNFLAAAAASAAMPGCAGAATVALRPEDFGARGDGVTNDTAAFAGLSAEVSRRGGGTIAFTAGRTYIVGSQTRGGRGKNGRTVAWAADPVLELRGLTGPLTILGNGARLRAQPGLRFGTFDPESGQPVKRAMPNYNASELAVPYSGLINIQDCRAEVTIRDLELDGNIDRLHIGGPFGDKGWQIPGTGLLLVGNHAPELIENVYSHHHGQDGAMIIGDDSRSARSRFSGYVGRYNGRQGLSITAGRGYDFVDCEFGQTGRSAIASPPGAGVDIEAEGGKLIRDLTFTRCRFVDNHGVGLLADAGDSEGVRFSNCRFVGTTNWSAWPRKPDYTFSGCTFVGAVVNAFADPDSSHATRFVQCRFTDDPRLSPTGQVFTGGGPIVNLGGKSDNVLFDGCTFSLVAAGVLPWSAKAIYRDCTMSQRSPRLAQTRGRYVGRTSIEGPVNLNGSVVEGTLIVNGRQVPPGPVG